MKLLNIPSLLPIVALLIYQIETKNPPKIAIVGAGIGGSSSAHFLRELFGDDALIDVYESGEIGGRLNSVEIGGREYEAGASILHPKNEYMVNFTRLFGLRPRDNSRVRLGIFDGDQLAVDGSDWKLVLLAQLVWRYGWDIFTVNNYVDKLIKEFANIYENQDRGMAFTTTEKLIESLSPAFSDLLTRSIGEEVKKNGISDVYIREVLRGALRTNYGQNEDIHGLVGAMSLAGVQPGLWAVHGGNRQIAEQLLKKAKANVIRSKVTKVTLKPRNNFPNFEIQIDGGATKEYCVVIVATPLHKGTSDIQFGNFPKPIGNFPGEFHRTVATFVKGQIDVSKFGVAMEDSFPEALLTSEDKLHYNSIGTQTPVDYTVNEAEAFERQTKVWKLFSPKPLTADELKDLFLTIEETKVVDWLAYPHYESTVKDIPPFQLYPQLYYINGIEWMGSTVETSVIGARNVALLAHHTWFEKPRNIDRPPMNVVRDKKIEL